LNVSYFCYGSVGGLWPLSFLHNVNLAPQFGQVIVSVWGGSKKSETETPKAEAILFRVSTEFFLGSKKAAALYAANSWFTTRAK
jgi:hypothetical protein